MGRKPNVEARERIVGAARLLIHERGFAGVSMDDVAAASGLKKANLFHYYPTKEELGAAVFDLAAAAHRERVRERFADGGDPVTVVRGMYADAARMMSSNGCCKGCLVGNLAQELSDHNERLRRKISETFGFWRQELAAFLARARERGRFKPSLRPEEAAQALLSLFEGAMLLSKANKQIGPLEDAERMAAAYLEGYRKHGR